MSLPQFIFLQIKGHYVVKKLNKIKQNWLALMIITMYYFMINTVYG